LNGRQITNGQELLDAILAVLLEITKIEILAMYKKWIERLKEITRTHGEYHIK
jgi:hypothetical protein